MNVPTILHRIMDHTGRIADTLEKIADAMVPYPKATPEQRADKEWADDESPRLGCEREDEGPRGEFE